VETCTVTAPDAITAFAVPNLSGTSQNRRFFRVWSLQQVTLPERITQSTLDQRHI